MERPNTLKHLQAAHDSGSEVVTLDVRAGNAELLDYVAKLEARDAKLRKLENGGVENWEWYGASLEAEA